MGPPRAFLLPLLALAACGGPPDGVRARSDVVLVVVDTLRADALSAYGNPRPTSPHLDALAADGIRFEYCWAQAPNTATSHATLFTGLSPFAHRVANLTSLEHGTAGLPPAFETLAERFRDAGYATAAFTDGGPLGRAWNLMQGFDVLEARYEGVEAKVDQALAFLEAREDDRPLFLFLHTYQTHLPYLAPEEWADRYDPDYGGLLREAEARVRAQRSSGEEVQPDGKLLLERREEFTDRDVEHLIALYHGEVAWTDHQLGRLFERLREDGTYDDAVVAVTSDHGEEFGEHGLFGHRQLHAETLRVPLILRLPGGALGEGRVQPTPVRLIDLPETLLAAVDLPGFGHGGANLLVGLREDLLVPRRALAETTEHLYPWVGAQPFRRSVREGDRAVLSTLRDGQDEVRMYDLRTDPDELTPVLAARTDSGNRLPPASASGEDRTAVEYRQAAEAGRRAIAEHLQAELERRFALLSGQTAVTVLPPDPDAARTMGMLGYAGEAGDADQ